MNVLVHILKGREGYQTFDVDVAVELRREIRVVWDNPPIINHDPTNLVFLAIVRSVVKWVALPVDARVWLERLWKVFCALSVFETPIAAAMHHAPPHSFEQQGLSFWVWPVRSDSAVNVSRGEDLLSVPKEDQNVCMR